ncbi:MAG: hypothetical protein J6R47_01715 [Acholeplasmatales bacterium]|nr:hypothetical protein [Acholeplasmatales bacterium]
MATNVENVALANNIELFKNYVDDPNNTYGVLTGELVTGDLETSMVEFIGASTMSYPVMPLPTGDLPNYSKTNGYERLNVALERREVTVTQDKGYQLAIDALDLIDSHTTAIQFLNHNIRTLEVPSVDKYRLNKLSTTATAKGAVTDDPLADYDKAAASLFNAHFPLAGTILYVNTTYYNKLKASDRIKRTLSATEGNITSTVTMIDGVTKLVVVPQDKMPTGAEFILVSPLAVIAGVKRNKSSVKDDPEDFDGVLVNRRLTHDCFVLEDRVKGIYVGTSA